MTSEAEAAGYLAEIFSPVQLRVYDALIHDGPTFRDTLGQKLGIPRTTVYDSLKFLEKLGLAARRVVYHAEHCRGRPFVEWYLVGRDE